MKIKFIAIFIISILLVGTIGFFVFSERKTEKTIIPSKEYKIAYMGADLESLFWIILSESLDKVSKEKGVKIIDLTPRHEPSGEFDLKVESMLNKTFDAVILGLAGEEKLDSIIDKLKEKDVPIFAIDLDIEDEEIKGFAGLDNYGSGMIAGEYIYKETNGIGSVLIIIPNEEHLDSIQRGAGAKDVLEQKGMTVVLESMDDLHWITQPVYNFAIKELAEDKGYSAILTAWDEGTLTVRNVAQSMGKYDDLIYVGFDGTEKMLDKIDEGYVSATIFQPTDLIAEKSVEMIIKYLEGEEYEEDVLVPGILVTKENVDEYSRIYAMA